MADHAFKRKESMHVTSMRREYEWLFLMWVRLVCAAWNIPVLKAQMQNQQLEHISKHINLSLISTLLWSNQKSMHYI